MIWVATRKKYLKSVEQRPEPWCMKHVILCMLHILWSQLRNHTGKSAEEHCIHVPLSFRTTAKEQADKREKMQIHWMFWQSPQNSQYKSGLLLFCSAFVLFRKCQTHLDEVILEWFLIHLAMSLATPQESHHKPGRPNTIAALPEFCNHRCSPHGTGQGANAEPEEDGGFKRHYSKS